MLISQSSDETEAGSGSPYKVLDEDFSIEPYAFALSRNDSDVRLAVNKVLAGLFRSGEIETLYNRWLGPMGRPSLLLSAARQCTEQGATLKLDNAPEKLRELARVYGVSELLWTPPAVS